MIGLAFASLVTWTIFIARWSKLTVVQGKLRGALTKISEARSLAEAQFALGAKGTVLSSFIAAAMREGRLSAGISSDSGVKERAASSFSEIVRAEARRIRLGMGLLATIGATSPFVGLFGTVWGNHEQLHRHFEVADHEPCLVAPGIAEALLATAIGLVAAIPAVIIYNHFSRVTKGYLELVNRAAARRVGCCRAISIAPMVAFRAARAQQRRSRRWQSRSPKTIPTTTSRNRTRSTSRRSST